MGTLKFRHRWIVDEVIVKQMNVWFCKEDEEPFEAAYLLSAITSEPMYANISIEGYNNTGLFHMKKFTEDPNKQDLKKKTETSTMLLIKNNNHARSKI